MRTCSVCGVEQPEPSFNRKGSSFQSKCRNCQKEWYKAYYESNDKERDRLIQKRKTMQQEFRLKIDELKDVPCMDCGQKYPPYVMDFDHRGDEPKLFNIGNMRRQSMNRVLVEVAKCDVICSNCHRKRTHTRRLSLIV